jgi:hypothetical protein
MRAWLWKRNIENRLFLKPGTDLGASAEPSRRRP